MENPITVDLTAIPHPDLDLRERLDVGEPVEVLSSFNRRWTHGFSVAVVDDAKVKLRRLSDGQVLPAWFPATMIRPTALH